MVKDKAKAMLLYENWFKAMLEMPDSLMRDTFKAIGEYAYYGTIPTDPAVKYGMFGLVRQKLDEDLEAYKEKCSRNSENGKRGGAPKDNQNARKTQKQPKQPKTTENNHDIDIDKDKEKDKENGCVCHTPAHTREEARTPYENFLIWMKENTPYCANPDNWEHFITEDEFKALYWSEERGCYGAYRADVYLSALRQLENKKAIRRDMANLYEAIKSFAEPLQQKKDKWR